MMNVRIDVIIHELISIYCIFLSIDEALACQIELIGWVAG